MEKNKHFLQKITQLNNYHYQNSIQYKKIVDLVYSSKKKNKIR